MAIEIKNLGVQPLVEKQVDGTFKAKLCEQEEIVATGKDVPALRGLLKNAELREREKEQQALDKYGVDRIADRFGNVHVRRHDEIANLETMGNGWGSKPAKSIFVMPPVPWKRKHEPRPGRTVVRYVDGERIETYYPK